MTVQIGELRARLVAEANQMKQEIRAVKQEFAGLGEQSKKTAAEMDKITATRERINILTQTLVNVNARIEIQRKKLEELRKSYDATFNESRRTKLQEQILRTESALIKLIQTSDRTAKEIWELEDSLSAANEEMKETSTQTSRAASSLQGFTSAIAALGSGVAFNRLKSTITTLADEAHRLSMSYSGLAEVARATNVDVEAAVDLAEELANRWGLNKAVLADTVKTYLTAGLTLEQTRDIIIATADAAVYNREAHLQWDEAIRQVAQGIKMGNSNLTDAAGITTNLSVMYERYAKTIGKTAATLTEAEKIQAAYNGIMQEAAMFAGNADKAMTGYTGTQATFNQTLAEARVELGEAFLPVLEDLMETVTPVIREFATFAGENKEFVAGIAAATTAVTGFIAVIGALSAAFTALRAAMGPVALAVTAIGALITGTLAYSAAADAAAGSVWKFARNQEELNQKLSESPLNRTTTDVQNLQADIEKLNELLERRRQLEERISEIRPDPRALSQTRAVTPEIRELNELQKELEELDEQLAKLGIDTPDKAPKVLAELQKQLEGAIPAMLELNRAEAREIATQIEHIDKITALRNRYVELNSLEKLNAAQKAELTSIVQELKREYPNLLTYYDEEKQLRIENLEKLDESLEAEKKYYKTRAEEMKKDLENMRKHTEARLELLRAEVEAMKSLSSSLEKPPANLPAYARNAGMTTKRVTDERLAARQDEINALELALTEIDKRIASIQSGNYKDLFQIGRAFEDAGTTNKKKSGGKQRTLGDIQREQYQEALSWIQYRRELNRMTEQEELEALNRLLKRFYQNEEIRRDIEVRIYRLKQQIARKSFEESAEWIKKEEERMILAGKTEQEIIQMKLEAWTRVRNRFEKDSEFYKAADDQLRRVRIENLKLVQKVEEEAAKERELRTKDLTRTLVDEIEKAKRAELEALDERRREIQRFYNEQIEALDESERLRERNELIAEMEKYRFATSEKGQKRFRELQEQLRRMDVEDQKRSLQKQRDQELEALDRRKRDIEAWYNDLREATQDLTNDLTALYKLADDERLASFISTNERIKEEMRRFKNEMSAIMVSGTSSVSGSQVNTIIQQMQANSRAWHTASAEERARLEAENQRLGAMIGATYNPREGRWYRDGVPLYHSGGIAGLMNFRSPDILLPDEISAILKRGEVTLTEKQIGSLVEALSGRGGGTEIHIDKIIEVENAYFEDEIDMRAFGREAGDTAAEILRRKLTGGVGVE